MISLKTAKRNRLDLEIVKRGLVSLKKKANALIMAGEVFVDGQIEYKSDRRVTSNTHIEIKKRHPYVSRGAFKIEKAFKDFAVNIRGFKVIDIGISTGGFTDYMLKNGAHIVVGVDVNIEQVDYNLRKIKELKLLNKNARYLKKNDIDFLPDLITIDVSFISVTKILPALSVFDKSKVLTLIKPQFEAKRSQVRIGGVIREKKKRVEILLNIKKKIEGLNYAVSGFTSAGLKGRKGNQEYFFLLEYGKKSTIDDKIIYHAT